MPLALARRASDRTRVDLSGAARNKRMERPNPALLATTKQFLDDLGLASVDQLPLLSGDVPDAQTLAGALAGPALLPETAPTSPELLDDPAADAAPMEPHE